MAHLKALFKLCKLVKADVSWIKNLDDPYLLFDLASIKGSADAVHLLLRYKLRYDLKYFEFIDFVVENKVLASMIKDFVCLLENKFIKFDNISWRKLLCQFSNTINKNDEKEAAK